MEGADGTWEQWGVRLVERLAQRSPCSAMVGWSGSVQVVVVDGGRDLAAWRVRVADGVVGVATVSPEDADVVVTVEASDLRAVATGALDVSVGYMRGDIKVDGPTGATLAVLAAASSACGRQALTEVDVPVP
jgi:hypothetical protein